MVLSQKHSNMSLGACGFGTGLSGTGVPLGSAPCEQVATAEQRRRDPEP